MCTTTNTWQPQTAPKYHLAVLCVYCAALDGVVRMGRSLKDRAPQSDHETLHSALVQLKTKWAALCSKAVDRFVSPSLSLYVCPNMYISICFIMKESGSIFTTYIVCRCPDYLISILQSVCVSCCLCKGLLWSIVSASSLAFVYSSFTGFLLLLLW